MFKVYSYNVPTDEKLLMGEFETYDEAIEAIEWDNLEWDEGDVVSDYQILITEDDRNFEIIADFTVEMDWEDDVDECGFDPYEGCYTYDC